MTVGDEVFGSLKTLPTDVLVGIVRAVHPDAKLVKITQTAPLCGRRDQWNIVSDCQCKAYGPVSLVGEREAWLYTVQRICRNKWPMASKELIQEGV